MNLLHLRLRTWRLLICTIRAFVLLCFALPCYGIFSVITALLLVAMSVYWGQMPDASIISFVLGLG